MLNADRVASAAISGRKNGNESGTAKKRLLCDLSMLLSILSQFHPFLCFLSNFKMLNMLTKSHQPESMVRNGKEPGTAKKMRLCDLLMLNQFWVNFPHFSCFLSNFKKCSILTKSHLPQFMAGHANESGTAKMMPSLWSDYAFINMA